MEFITVHELSRQFNISARSVRYRLLRLIDARKFKNGEDYRREDYVDPQHFVWKINPESFLRETQLQRTSPPTEPALVVNESGNQPLTDRQPVVHTSGNHHPGSPQSANNPVTPGVNHGSQSVNHRGNQFANKAEATVHTVALQGIEREMIDMLKTQLTVKDTQIKDLTQQVNGVNELNLKLNAALLQNGEKIENLLQLTGGKMAEGSTETPLEDKLHEGTQQGPQEPRQAAA
ncbi:MAG: hypothetical protein AB3N14_01615 [Flavobacteriaceae bacterium]